MPMWEAFVADAPAPLAALLGEVSASHRRVVVLYDLMNAFVAEEAARLPNGRGFGSMSSLRDEQISELAAALRVCNYRFIWVLRDAVRANMFTGDGDSRHAKLLPEFTQETEGRGLVITGWAPQLEMLAHGATAAFLSHFGWNSTVESMSHRKPILAWPMHSDQPWDAELICKYFKAGFLVRPCEQHHEVIPAARIREVFEKLMDSDEGRAVRQRATMLGEAVRVDAAVGGASNKNLEDFISHITR
jgi:cis-zeatin O-glucosyltransferase